ncbi:hypothetical protein SLEP1_g38642 [Rubroshorea leprosula]|uniref:Uncharacterized protein n=1 Tax=Rubroshorea leprosula TaxID=152421 RepID=A0AAV5KXN3_9ROSI|nr:hypothetical protein SLEP1_g38642 [Rubroshorea leprosula]
MEPTPEPKRWVPSNPSLGSLEPQRLGSESREYWESVGNGMGMFPNGGAWWVWGATMTAMDSGRRALQFLGLDEEKRNTGFQDLKVDVIITDYCVLGMSSYDLLKKIKKLKKWLKKGRGK